MMRKYIAQDVGMRERLIHALEVYEPNTRCLYGPSALFLKSIQALGWSINDELEIVVAPRITIHLRNTPKQALMHRACESWEQVLCNRLHRRNDMFELSHYSRLATNRAYAAVPAPATPFVRAA